jgi:hypothetical protein
MIIIRLSGGVGNQLFQYATGRALSLKNNTQLRLDISAYDLNIEPNRSFKLDAFNIPSDITIASQQDFKSIGVHDPHDTSAIAKIKRKISVMRKKFIREKSSRFEPSIMNCRSNCYLSGVWQSEKYFKEYASYIQSDLTLKKALSVEATALASQITSSNAVSLHVRRGDYVSVQKYTEKHGVQGSNYYQRAIDKINSEVMNPHYFIFSDDVEWVKENIAPLTPALTIVSGTKNITDIEEMRLMSMCKHNIVANSSFSWWGAWLNPNPKKIVIAPKIWFQSDISSEDLIPASWIRM